MPYTETKADTEPPQNVRQQPNELNAMYRQMIASLDIPREQFDAFSKAVRDGVPVCRLLGIDKETIDKRYALAYQLYTSEKYTEAMTVFSWLCVYSNTTAANWMGLGACQQALNDFENAAQSYAMAAIYGAFEDPSPFYYMGICSMNLKRKDLALAAFEAAATYGDNANPKHTAIRERASAVLRELQNEEH